MHVRDICSVSDSGIRECPTLFPWYACNNNDLETYAKLIMHAPMRTLKHQVCGHVTLRLRIHFAYLNQPSVSKRCSFINLCIHPSPFRLSEKLPQHSPFGCTHIFFQKSASVLTGENFPKRNWQLFLFKSVLAFLFLVIWLIIVFLCKGLETVCKLGTIGIRNYILLKKRRATESTQYLRFWRFKKTIAMLIWQHARCGKNYSHWVADNRRR